ncbi:flagellar basal body-associated protein FliL [Azonexus sp. IMCC34839]|uniref:flagellar basal body-associated FliL family protein n=1 Tax=Azonexus sp. IMCC34839 TaxID=3133695 RepID=UPI0039998F3C
MRFKLLRRILACLMLTCAVALPMSANASGGGGGAPEPLVFTTNAGKNQYLQFGIILEPAVPEAQHLIAGYKPKIQHEILLMLADKDVNKLRTLQGKKELAEEIVEIVNHIIHEDEKTGVKEVLFTKFLIQ